MSKSKKEKTMHSKPMAEHEGVLKEPAKELDECPKCKKKAVKTRIWESNCGGFEDEKHECQACGHVFWVEGIDS
jgi:uncharacterized protein with PIN domain